MSSSSPDASEKPDQRAVTRKSEELEVCGKALDQPDEGMFVIEESGSDADLAAELGFEPAVSATGRDAVSGDAVSKAAAATHPLRMRRGSGLRRRVGAFAILLGALSSMGGAYAAFASSSGAVNSNASAASIERGKQLYDVTCITCHGANLQGVTNRGLSLIGVGGAAVYFQVSTGRMPAAGQSASIQRKTAKFDDADTRALAAYVQSIGGGTAIPTGKVRGGDASIAEGGELFRLNCSSCHGVTGKGAPLSAGKVAPGLNQATDLQMTTAMLSGPESMPVFGNNQLSTAQKQAIVAYVQTLKASADPGGSGIDRIGPVSEAIVLWVAGIGVLMVAILWIGARSQ